MSLRISGCLEHCAVIVGLASVSKNMVPTLGAWHRINQDRGSSFKTSEAKEEDVPSFCTLGRLADGLLPQESCLIVGSQRGGSEFQLPACFHLPQEPDIC